MGTELTAKYIEKDKNAQNQFESDGTTKLLFVEDMVMMTEML